jgi:hypothetical protein
MKTPFHHQSDGNFVRAFVGAEFDAAAIQHSGVQVIKICMPERLASADPATIILPPARRWQGREITIVDATGLGFLLIPREPEIIHGDVAMRSVVRLMPLLTDQDDEQDAWYVVGFS